MVDVFGIKMIGLLDSGANCTIMGSKCLEFVNKLGLKTHEMDNTITTADGISHPVLLYVYLSFKFNGRKEVLRTLLVPSFDKELVLGMDFWNRFNIQPTIKSEVCAVNLDSEPENHALSVAQLKQLKDVSRTFLRATRGKLTQTTATVHTIDTGLAEPVTATLNNMFKILRNVKLPKHPHL